MESSRQNQSLKRKRLSHACNWCRSQKKRCDEQKPSCRNCTVAGQACITTDPRKPGAPEVERRRARSKSPSISLDASQNLGQTPGSDDTRLTATTFSRDVPSTPQTSVPIDSPLSSSRLEMQTGRPEVLSPSTPFGRVALGSPSTTQGEFQDGSLRHGQPTMRALQDVTQSSFGPEDDSVPENTISQAALNSDGSLARKKYLGASSLQVFAQWVDLVLMAHGNKDRLSEGFRHGMRYAEEFHLPLTVSRPTLKSLGDISNHLQVYLDRINPMYPFVDKEFLFNAWFKLRDYDSLDDIPSEAIPELVCIYTTVAVAANEAAGSPCQMGIQLLEAAYSLYGHIIAHPYLTSVQALGVMTIALRGRHKDGAGSQILGQAIRIATSIGLHRADMYHSGLDTIRQNKIWWACYCLERDYEFETGRPSTVSDDFIRQRPPSLEDDEMGYLQAAVSLGQIRGRINDEIFSQKASGLPPKEMVPVLGRFDDELAEWTNQVPELIRPGREVMYCPPEMLPFATVLSLQYYSTLAMIHRTSMLIDPKLHRSMVESACAPSKWKHKVSAGESICVNAARSIVRSVKNMLSTCGPSQLISPSQSIVAVYILLIHVMRSPLSWTIQSDLEMIKHAVHFLEQSYSISGQDPQFIATFTKLYTIASTVVTRAATSNSEDMTSGSSIANGLSHPSHPLQENHTLQISPSTVSSVTNLHIRPQDETQLQGGYPGHTTLGYGGTYFDHQNLAVPSPGTLDRLWSTTLSDTLMLPRFANHKPASDQEEQQRPNAYQNNINNRTTPTFDPSIPFNSSASNGQAHPMAASSSSSIARQQEHYHSNHDQNQDLHLSSSATWDTDPNAIITLQEAQYLLGLPSLEDVLAPP